jgi:hypothetical protein
MDHFCIQILQYLQTFYAQILKYLIIQICFLDIYIYICVCVLLMFSNYLKIIKIDQKMSDKLCVKKYF